MTILREADRTTVAEAAKKYKVREPKIYAWRKHSGQLEVAGVKRLKALELEDGRLKKLPVERDLDIEVLKEINAKDGAPAGSTRPDRLRARAWPEPASGCGLIGMSRVAPSYQPSLPAQDAPVIEAMKELSAQFPR